MKSHFHPWHHTFITKEYLAIFKIISNLFIKNIVKKEVSKKLYDIFLALCQKILTKSKPKSFISVVSCLARKTVGFF